MLKNIIKALAVTALGVGLAAPAFASTGLPASTTPRQTIEYLGVNTALPGFTYKVPALAQNAIDTCFVYVAPVWRGFGPSSGVPYVDLVSGYASTVAGDSINVSIDVGTNSEGPWLNVVSLANAYSHTASLAVRNNVVATSTLLVAPYWRVRLKSKGTAALVAGKKFYFFFANGNPGMQALKP